MLDKHQIFYADPIDDVLDNPLFFPEPLPPATPMINGFTVRVFT